MKDYKKILEGVVNIINTTEKSDIGFANICTYIGEKCPEIKESEDERVKKRILLSLEKDLMATKNSGCSTKDLEDCITWLEKQGEHQQLYIRFGDIPANEKSKIYRGEKEIGIENGVSVYPAFKSTNGDIVLGLNLPITKTTLHTQQHLLEYDNRPCYLVTGDYIGKDTDGQILISNVNIIEKIDNYRVKTEKQGDTTSDTKYEVKDGGSLSVSASDYKYATITQKDFAPINDTDEEIVNAAKNTSVIDMVGPKFKVGDWVVTDKNDRVQIKAVNNSYYTIDNGMYFNIPYVDRCWHLWAVQDAKDGDVLAVDPIEGYSSPFVCIYKRQNQEDSVDFDSHCFVAFDGKFYIGEKGHSTEDIHPATKEQRDLLFQKMEEAGYEWDAEKKELKKIEDEEYNGDDYGIDGLWHAQRILEKTLGSVDGYQSDDGILEHKAAITAVKKLYEQKPSWSYEDEANLNNIIWLCNNCINGSETTWIPSQAKKIKHLIKTVKKRGLSQQKPTEWSDEDERNLNGIIDEIIANRNKGPIYDIKTYNIFLGWLKSLKDRATWKPSDEQMEILKELIDDNNQRFFYPTLKSLYNDLKKL